jgi:protease IV
MKTFFASLLGTLAALMLLLLGSLTALVLLIGIAASMGEKKPSLGPGTMLVVDLDMNISDAPSHLSDSALLEALSGRGGPAAWQLRSVTRALDAAATDDRIAGIFLTGSLSPQGYGASYAALAEVRRALERVRAAGKPIHAHVVYPTTRDYYLATVATDLAIDPFGLLLVPGLASQPTFFAGAFEKLGVGVQLITAGDYKSAGETFTRRDFSDENREQLEALLGDLWSELRDTMARARGLEGATLQHLVDTGEGLQPEEALQRGLVDRMAYRDEIIADLKAATGQARRDRSFKQISLSAYARLMGTDAPGRSEIPVEAAGTTRGTIAVVYAEGAIVDGDGGTNYVGGDRVSRELRRLRQDDRVRAIVLRVNSPGGSATASEHIRRELMLAAETKPVVVSMGGVAASGGYWIATAGERIFAEPSTITGSIGVIGMLINVAELGDKMGLTWDTVKTGNFADIATISRPKTPEELALLERLIVRTYDSFLQRVVESRGLTREQAEAVARGRVWSGQDALAQGLVDELGGLAEAVAYAAGRAGLRPDFQLVEFPRRKELGEAIAELMERLQPAGAGARGALPGLVRQLEREWRALGAFNDPRGIYARWPVEALP